MNKLEILVTPVDTGDPEKLQSASALKFTPDEGTEIPLEQAILFLNGAMGAIMQSATELDRRFDQKGRLLDYVKSSIYTHNMIPQQLRCITTKRRLTDEQGPERTT